MQQPNLSLLCPVPSPSCALCRTGREVFLAVDGQGEVLGQAEGGFTQLSLAQVIAIPELENTMSLKLVIRTD